MNGLSFAHLSDLHLPFAAQLSVRQRFSKRQLSVWSWQRHRRTAQRPEILHALAQDVRAHAPEHIVITGDITNFSLPGEFAQAAQWLDALAPAQCISVVPGNHDALVALDESQGLAQWQRWLRLETGWPWVHRLGNVALIGVNSARPTAPLLAGGALGDAQLSRLEAVLRDEGGRGHLRVLALHHPVAEGAVSARKALADRARLRAILARIGAELVLHGHARSARLDALDGPAGPIPCICVPSSTAVPNQRDEGARWHLMRLPATSQGGRASVLVRQWSLARHAFVDAARYELCLPRLPATALPHSA